MKPTAPLSNAWTWTKEALINVLKVLGSLFLVAVALVLICFLPVPALGWKIYASFRHEDRQARDIITGTAAFFIAIAKSLDKFGNVAFGGFFNAVLLRRQYYKFGNTYETISEVLGWAERYNDLTPLGEKLLTTVNALDPFDDDHCRNAMVKGVEIARFKTKLFNQLNPPL